MLYQKANYNRSVSEKSKGRIVLGFFTILLHIL
jgi:hypothetical protein